MNQEQRKFLIANIEGTYRSQIEKLKGSIPKKPSLNNHLIAAFLDDSIEYADLDALKVLIRQRVLKMGRNETLVEDVDEEGYSYSGNRRNRSGQNGHGYIKLTASEVFKLPKSYIDALAEFNALCKKIEDEISELEAVQKTLLLKVNIGSNAILDKLIEQVDNMGDLKLLNTSLLLSPDEPKKLGNSK